MKLPALPGSQLTYCGKGVCMVPRKLFQRMLGNHIEFPGFHVAVQMIQLGVEHLIVAGYGPPHGSGMGGKDGAYGGQILFQIEQTCTCLPLMKLGHNFLVLQIIEP